ncbi:MAG: FAD-dependent oxidoreductase [Planctomycetes bacterium]|nr:FAD-dependent oxidoreductase [Planctomycetota bacterium]
MSQVLILGGGPSGVGAAWQLRQSGKADVDLLEREMRLGGNAGSFEWKGHRLDYGSHRLHPATDAKILADIQGLLGDDLLDRPRHGRIRLRGRWLHFPLKPVDLALRTDRAFLFGTLKDAIKKAPAPPGDESFATVLRANLGPTICDHFYFPYAQKIWGRDPHQLAAVQAHRRVSAGSFGKLVRKVLGSLPGLKKPGAGRFYYPRDGFGAITEAYAAEAARRGARIHLGHEVRGLRRRTGGWSVEATTADGQPGAFEADQIWSTIPVTVLVRLLGEGVPAEVQDATRGISYRSMVLCYLDLEVDQFTEFDAHYFPGIDLQLTRLSEPKNYAVRTEPAGRTVLCAEIPCDLGDAIWKASDRELGDRVAEDLALAGIPLPRPYSDVTTRRLPQAYPIYERGFEAPLELLDHYVSSCDDLLSFGRQGLFAHDNTHHTLAMAYAAVDCLSPEGFDKTRWRDYRKIFETHVVED